MTLDEPSLPDVMKALKKDHMIFKYANLYSSQYEVAENFEDFSFDTYDEFKKFLIDENFEYKTSEEKELNKLIKAGKMQELELYKQHVIDQALKILRAHDNIKCVFTTPKLLESLCEKISLPKYGISGIFCGGTEMNAQFHRFAREELIPGVDFQPTYGNTLMGLACNKPFDRADDYAITYYGPHPRAVFELVDPDNPDKLVDYGETGRVILTTLTKEFFMPRFLERDEGERAEPIHTYPWDGVSNLRLFSRFQQSVVVGVY